MVIEIWVSTFKKSEYKVLYKNLRTFGHFLVYSDSDSTRIRPHHYAMSNLVF